MSISVFFLVDASVEEVEGALNLDGNPYLDTYTCIWPEDQYEGYRSIVSSTDIAALSEEELSAHIPFPHVNADLEDERLARLAQSGR